MPHYEKKTELPYSSHQMFTLVSDITSYPHFVPYCVEGQVASSSENSVVASLTFGAMGFTTTLTTKNTFILDKSITMEFVQGSLKDLHGQWLFEDKGTHCEVGFNIVYNFHNSWTDPITEGILGKVILSMHDIFAHEAKKRYG